jgi:ATP-dependent DNA helicase RecG
LQRARALAPRLLDTHPQAAEAHVQRWLGSRSEYFKA